MMKHKRITLFFLLIIGIVQCTSDKEKTENTDDIYGTLEQILIERKNSLKVYMSETQKMAQDVRNDENMVNFFKAQRAFYYLNKKENLPARLSKEIEKLHQNIQHYYILNYQSFYDILFVDKRGEIFYTILKQEDYGKNIFKGDLANTKLSKKIQNMPKESFVDFQFYEMSGEPSAFFIEPLIENGETIGWFVLQCAINKINNLFTLHKNIGQTGEIVLVNKDHYMLTNSRFRVNPTILKQQLPEENIEWKFKKRKGRKDVVDYRGKEVFSVFEVFEFLGSEWLIIAKMDKSEVITQKYLKNEGQYFDVLKKSFSTDQINSETNPYKGSPIYKVDIDEFGRNDTCGVIATQGVSTCTAVAINYPGRFSYMAHISPHDVVYGETRTDLLSQVFKQILYFDITESEKQNLEFYIMSTQLKSIKNVTKKILDKGFFLSQIKFAYNPNASYGNIYSNCSNNKVVIDWVYNSNISKIEHASFDQVNSFEKILRNNTTIISKN
ncbi:MAG: hypothetical protein KQH79_05190 [Bacteroidetes bacterium]|nr:hypothetical protein [Bacteroidota bacterium]